MLFIFSISYNTQTILNNGNYWDDAFKDCFFLYHGRVMNLPHQRDSVLKIQTGHQHHLTKQDPGYGHREAYLLIGTFLQFDGKLFYFCQ